MRYAFSFVFAASCFLLLGATTRGRTDDDEPIPPPKVEPRANLKASEILAILDETIDRDEIAEPTELGKALNRIDGILKRRGKSLPWQINVAAFRLESPDGPDIKLVPVVGLDQPVRPSVRQVLRHYTEQFREEIKASYIVGPGYVEITTAEESLLLYRLGTPVTVNVRNRPLHAVLDDLFEQTGVSITIDARFAQRARVPVTATFSDPMALRDAIYLLTNMADLQMVSIGNSVYVTSPQNAHRIYWQRILIRELPFMGHVPQL